MTPASAIEVRGVTRNYGAVRALRGVDLDVFEGEVFALLGPNGAGKTTLVEILEGYRDRTGGDVSVLGTDPRHGGSSWRGRIGIVLQNTTVFDMLTVSELVRHFAGFYASPLEPARVIDMVGLAEKANVRCGKLSGGQKRRVDLALGLVGNPELVFLDEPTTGLDPEGRRQLWDVIRGFTALGTTVLLTTHYLEEAEALAGRVGVIIAGEMVDVGPPAAIGGRDRALSTVRFEAGTGFDGGSLPALEGMSVEGPSVTVRTARPTEAVRVLAAWAEAQGWGELPGLTVTRPSLEDTYLAMVRAREAPAA
jgi:ABC-2 type transport system ATP-binding protein